MTAVPLAEGQKAPAFFLSDKDGSKHRLSQLLNEHDYAVIFFYPRDNTPGCAIEAASFSSNLKKFEKLNTIIIGISGGDEKSKTKFCKRLGLKTLLLSDTDFSVANKYGVYGPKKFMGKTYEGISRVTFIVDAKQKICKVFPKVKPATHTKEVLEAISSLSVL